MHVSTFGPRPLDVRDPVVAVLETSLHDSNDQPDTLGHPASRDNRKIPRTATQSITQRRQSERHCRKSLSAEKSGRCVADGAVQSGAGRRENRHHPAEPEPIRHPPGFLADIPDLRRAGLEGRQLPRHAHIHGDGEGVIDRRR
ncbi:hypothetical protein BGL_1c08420 [Burkholderia plantarii]|uniref:Uncharacterized protein n=1 Tax=Burkholderia plantarii TaxID=41899 RepID=A0A0B6RWH5_BURPL|nr:hypothetical protein BGL_1c08420 [Burkholderia plantarii]